MVSRSTLLEQIADLRAVGVAEPDVPDDLPSPGGDGASKAIDPEAAGLPTSS